MERGREEPRASPSPSSNAAAAVPVKVGSWIPPPISVNIDSPLKASKPAWNTHRMGARLGADLTAAACAGVLVAPVITIIDRGIIENASGRNSLGDSIRSSLVRLFTRPHQFMFSKPFALIFTLYAGTYLTANASDTISSTLRSKPASTTSSGPSKFAATSTTNLALCLYKDKNFTQLFGRRNCIPRSVPAVTYALFTARDCLTVFASFNLPPLLSPFLAARLGDSFQRYISAASAAQFLAPAAVQLLSTPLHLLGLDAYNRPRVGTRERAAMVLREYGKSCAARMARIVPAFGVGGVVNTRVRRELMGRLD